MVAYLNDMARRHTLRDLKVGPGLAKCAPYAVRQK